MEIQKGASVTEMIQFLRDQINFLEHHILTHSPEDTARLLINRLDPVRDRKTLEDAALLSPIMNIRVDAIKKLTEQSIDTLRLISENKKIPRRVAGEAGDKLRSFG